MRPICASLVYKIEGMREEVVMVVGLANLRKGGL